MAETGALLYGQAGGVTAVINASAAAVLHAARPHYSAVYAAREGILGLIGEDLLDTAPLTGDDLTALAHTPGGAFRACRHELPPEADAPALYDRIFAVLAAHRIRAFLYNGGNGSMDAVGKLHAAAQRRGYPLAAVGIAKTIDNDLEGTDCSPGYGSAARYLVASLNEAALDLAAMSRPGRGERVFLLETMGRHTGWLAAATALAAPRAPDAILLPEANWREADLWQRIDAALGQHGHVILAVAEGVRDPATGLSIAERLIDTHGHTQLGGAVYHLAERIRARFGVKTHCAIPDYLQRAAAHLRSGTDFAHAQALGHAAVAAALDGQSGIMVGIERLGNAPYRWRTATCDAARIANLERAVPRHFLTPDGLHLTPAALDVLRPLITGEPPAAPRGEDGFPRHFRPSLPTVPKRLPAWRGGE